MMQYSSRSIRLLQLSVLCCSCFAGSLTIGQEPQWNSLFPAGGQRGREVEVTLNGTFPTWPVTIWCDQADCVCTATETSGKIKVAIDADAPPGVRWLRIYDAKGASSMRPFVIGLTAEVNEAPADDKLIASQPVTTLPIVINGVLDKPGNADNYSIKLNKGQVLVANLDANRGPRSPVDATLQILNSNGIVLEQNLDCHGFDPQIVFQTPQDAEYQVRVFGFPETPDSTIAYAGNANYVYRLTLTTEPYLEGSVPLAVSRESANELVPIGFNLGPWSQLTVTAQPNASHSVAVFHLSAVGSLLLPVTNNPIVTEPLQPTESKQTIPVPSCITGRILAAKEQDEFSFESKAGTRWKMQLESRSLGYAMDGVLTLRDTEGKQLVQQDDTASTADPTIQWQCPADGTYSIAVSDLFGQWSELHLYRLSIDEEKPRAELSVPNDVLKGTVAQPLEIQVTIERKYEYADELSIQLEGAPASVTATPSQSVAGNDTSKTVKLVLQSDEPFQGPVQIVAQSKTASDAKFTATASNTNQSSVWLSIVAP